MLVCYNFFANFKAEDTAALLQLFDAGNTGRISAGLIPESLKKESMVEIKADGSAVLTGKGAIAAKAMSISRERFSSQLLQGTTPEERFVLISVLEKMLKNI